jgi:hypothetical protein
MLERLVGFGALVGVALAPAPAWAVDGEDLFGVGVRLGTSFIPGRYPATFPKDIDDDTTTLDRVGADLRIGIDGFYGIDLKNRVEGGIGTGFGTRYNDLWFTFGYGRVFVLENNFELVGHLETGFGSMKFTGTDEDEELRIPYFPIRARLTGDLLNESQLYGLGVLFGGAIPSRHNYTDPNGDDQEVKSAVSFGNYFFVGLELQALFGNVEKD